VKQLYSHQHTNIHVQCTLYNCTYSTVLFGFMDLFMKIFIYLCHSIKHRLFMKQWHSLSCDWQISYRLTCRSLLSDSCRSALFSNRERIYSEENPWTDCHYFLSCEISYRLTCRSLQSDNCRSALFSDRERKYIEKSSRSDISYFLSCDWQILYRMT
jgi:hypothetical protein